MIRGLLGAAAGVIGATVSDPEVGFPAWVDLTGVVAGFGLGLLASTGSATSLVVFARTRHFAFLRTAQLFLILVAPALGTVVLGGLRESSSVILWSLFAPLGAVAFDRPRRAWSWFAAFVVTVLLALVLSEVVRPNGADLPNGFVRTFDVLTHDVRASARRLHDRADRTRRREGQGRGRDVAPRRP